MHRRAEQLHSQKTKEGRWIWLLAVRMFGFDCNAGKIIYTLSALPLNGRDSSATCVTCCLHLDFACIFTLNSRLGSAEFLSALLCLRLKLGKAA
jgi:hypothetical protein